MGETAATTIEPQAAPAAPPGPGPGRSPWLRWAIPACLLLGVAGAARSRSTDRYEGLSPADVKPPFPMKQVAKDLGRWAFVDESDALLDPKIVQIAGCSDYLVRSYYNKSTGVAVTALVLYGPSHLVVPHTPEVCYPATGYLRFAGPAGHALKAGPEAVAQFRSLVYGMAGAAGAAPRLEEVYYSYRVNGRWVPSIPDREVFSRKTPAVFKVQIQRRITASERLDDHNPTEDFLASLLEDIEGRLAGPRPAGPTS